MRFAFIHCERDHFPITALCRAMQVARSGYHAWVVREDCARVRNDRVLAVNIAAAFARSRRTYGSPRIQAELNDDGIQIGRGRTARIIRENSLFARTKKAFRVTQRSCRRAWRIDWRHDSLGPRRDLWRRDVPRHDRQKRDQAQHESHEQSVGQRGHREFLQHASLRTACAHTLQGSRGSAKCDHRVDRQLLQLTTETHDDRKHEPDQVRIGLANASDEDTMNLSTKSRQTHVG